MSFKIIDNFLPKKYFCDVKNKLESEKFNWFYQNKLTYPDKNWEKFWFAHCFYENNLVTSPYYNLMHDTLIHLKAHATIRIRANLNVNLSEKYFADWHIDTDSANSKTAILYINNNNGYTELKNDNRIEKINCVENRIVIFDHFHEHRMASQTDTDRRIVVNFNYYG
tara:strand:- start:206 stop:706 length:501 start_codon:yes stop_codon:yes gene_type:complete